MNTSTGEVYMTMPEIRAAKKRGEPLVEIEPAAARRIVRAYEAEARDKARRRKAAKLARQSRKKNRR